MTQNKTRRAGLRAALALGGAILAALPAAAAEKVTILTSWLPGGDEAFPYIAQHEGLFAAEGLDVTILNGKGTTDVVTRLAAGSVDIGEGGLTGLLQARAQNDVPVRAVMSIYSMQPDAIFTTEGSGITSLKDLVGRKVATATFTSSNVVWPLLLKNNGIDPSQIDLIKVDPGTLVPMLATGKVDATINWQTTVPLFKDALAQGGKTLKVLPWSDYGFKGYGLSVFASDKTIKERPDVLRKVLAAYAKAEEMAKADPELAAVSLKAAVPETDEAVAAAMYAATIPLSFNATSAATGFGGFDKALLAETWEWTAKSQDIPMDKIDPETAVDRSFLPGK